MLKAETYIAGNSVRVVMVTAKLSLVSDIGRNCWGPLGPDTRIDNGTVMTFVRARKCRRRTGNSGELTVIGRALYKYSCSQAAFKEGINKRFPICHE